jgi:hypothetical protein
MTLKIGQQYKKTDFGITISKQLSEHIVAGELFTFFSMIGEFQNIIEKDGFIYEGRAPYVLIPYGVKKNLQRHVFVRMADGEDYTYLGKGLYESRYNDKCNKIFLMEN